MPAHRTAVLAVILVSYLMIVLDISIVITALPKIQRGLGLSTASLSWVQNAYTLSFGGLLLLGARAGDIVGRRRMFVAGLAIFTAASTLALLQTNFAEGPQRTQVCANTVSAFQHLASPAAWWPDWAGLDTPWRSKR